VWPDGVVVDAPLLDEHLCFSQRVEDLSVIHRRYIEGADRRRQHWHGFRSAADQHARILEGKI
jgi:hypothetical protein